MPEFIVYSPAFGSEHVQGSGRADFVFDIHRMYCRPGESVSLFKVGERGTVQVVRQEKVGGPQ